MPFHTQSDMLMSLVVLLIIASLTAYYANRKGRNPLKWFFLGVLLGIFAPLILLFLSEFKGNSDKEVEEPTMTISNPSPSLAGEVEVSSQYEAGEEENKLWYYLDEAHEQMGPVSVVALRELWSRGSLRLDSYVWSTGMEQWERVEDLPELNSELNKV